jgi:acyl phosphate:glycerol-3-phosphate acyltransferase
VTTALLVLAAYLIGAFPTSYVVGRATKGIDLRQHGSGNLGATNAFRVLGWRAASPIFVADILKGYLPAFWFPQIDGAASPLWALAYGTAAVMGHVFSVFVGFKGGKGVATSAGVFLALAPLALLGGLLVWAALVMVTGYVSLGSVAAAAVLPVLVYLSGSRPEILLLALLLATFVIYAHRANIRRLLRGEESRFGRRAATSVKPPVE